METIREEGNNMEETNRKDQDSGMTPEIEGDRYGWFYVCPECHGILNWKDLICPSCGERINWNG